MLLIDELRRQKYTGVFLRHFMSYAQGMKNYSECGQHLPLYLHKWGSPSGEWKQIALSKIENSLYNKEEKSIAALSGKKILFSNSQILSCLMMIQNLSYPLCKMSKFLIRSFSVISFPLFQLMQQGHANVKGHKLTESGNNNNALGTTTTKKKQCWSSSNSFLLYSKDQQYLPVCSVTWPITCYWSPWGFSISILLVLMK